MEQKMDVNAFSMLLDRFGIVTCASKFQSQWDFGKCIKMCGISRLDSFQVTPKLHIGKMHKYKKERCHHIPPEQQKNAAWVEYIVRPSC